MSERLTSFGAVDTLPVRGALREQLGWPCLLVVAYLALEYARPPRLLALGVSMVVVIALLLYVVAKFRRALEVRYVRWYLGLLLLMALHVPFAVNNYWAFQTLRGMAILFVVGAALVVTVDTPRRLNALITAWLVIHAYLAWIGLDHRGRGIGGFLGDENDFCMTLNMVMPFAFFLAVEERAGLRRVCYYGLVGLILAANVLTMSRGGFLGLCAVGAAAWWFSPRKVASGLVIAVLVLGALALAPAEYWAEMQTIRAGTEDATGAERIYQWKVAWAMFVDNPLFGVGQGNYPWNSATYELQVGDGTGFDGRFLAGRAAHSLYFTLLAELGVVGALVYGLGLAMVGRDLLAVRAIERRWQGDRGLVRRLRALRLAMAASLLGFLVSAVFISVLYYPNFWILAAFAAVLRRVAEHSHDDPASH